MIKEREGEGKEKETKGGMSGGAFEIWKKNNAKESEKRSK